MVCRFIDRPTGPPADLESAVDRESIRFLFYSTGCPGNLVSRGRARAYPRGSLRSRDRQEPEYRAARMGKDVRGVARLAEP